MNVKPYDMQHDVIIACDFKSAEDTFKFLDLFRGCLLYTSRCV